MSIVSGFVVKTDTGSEESLVIHYFMSPGSGG